MAEAKVVLVIEWIVNNAALIYTVYTGIYTEIAVLWRNSWLQIALVLFLIPLLHCVYSRHPFGIIEVLQPLNHY